MLVYPAIFETDENYFIVKFPDIPEAMTQGDSLEQAYEMAVEALGLALEDYTIFPQASSLQNIKELYPNSNAALIGIDLAAYRRKYHSRLVTKNVTIPEWLDNLAHADNIDLSQTLTEALKTKFNA